MERLSTVDLLTKLARLAKKVKKVILVQSCFTKQVGARRSTVLSLPTQLVFPVLANQVLLFVALDPTLGEDRLKDRHDC